ncbi:hypothetical protein HDV63DRAFT_34140 [Trichoderma sp. SZMC 28014]
MFGTQSYTDVMSESGRKRGRDSEGEVDGMSMGLDEHRSKRFQCLPLRTSPRSSQQWPSASSMGHESDGHATQLMFSRWSHSSVASSSGSHDDTEVDMMGSNRMPTPIQPSFAAQVRGQQNEWAGPGPVVTTLNGVINMGHHPSGFSDDQSVPRVMSGLEDWQAAQNHRRLPSPISEVEDGLLDQQFGEGSMMVDDGMGVTMDAAMVLPPSPSRAMDHPNAMMDIESPPRSNLHGADGEGDAHSPSPARRGHMRSKHTIDSWTWQPGMKKSFSIGYRADCEKCRLKVPGHFNHIVIS